MSGMVQAMVFAAIASLLSSVSSGQETTFEIRGSAVDINSRPLANVNVSLRTKEPGSDRSTVTDGSGAFAFTDLPPGSYSLRASAGGFNPVQIHELNVGQQRRILTLRLEMEVGLCPLSPGLPHYFRLLDGADDKHLSAFAGTVTNESGVAVPGATVALYIPGRGKIASTHTNENGSFTFMRLKVDSSYWIQVLSDGYLVSEFTNLASLPEYESIYDGLVLEACDPGACDPNLRKVQTLRCE
jgi:Carboxypeptidase regulatory-like domain